MTVKTKNKDIKALLLYKPKQRRRLTMFSKSTVQTSNKQPSKLNKAQLWALGADI